MKYSFLKENLSYVDDSASEQESKALLSKVKERRNLRFTVISFIFIGMIYIAYSIIIPFEIGFYMYHVYILAGCFGIYLILVILIIKYRTRMIVHKVLKYALFFIFYGVQVYWTINSYYIGNEFRLIRSIYVMLVITHFYAVIFYNLHLHFVLLIATSNFGILLFIQITNPFDHLYLMELSLGIIIPIGALLIRREFEQVVFQLTLLSDTNQKLLTYGDNLIDNFPCFFFTFADYKIVFINHVFDAFLKGNQSSENPELEENEKKTLSSKKPQNYQMAENFLAANKFTYIDPYLTPLLEKGMKSDIKEKSILEILFFLQDSNWLITGQFYYLGINEGITHCSMEKSQYNFSFRIVKSTERKWIEVFMADVTLSQKMKLVDNLFKMRESILSKIAHEFKTPLMCIVGLSEDMENIQNWTYDNKIKTQIKDISNLSNYTQFLIHDAINFLTWKKPSDTVSDKSKKLSGQMPYKVSQTNFSLNDVLYFCFEILKTLLKYSKNKIETIQPIVNLEVNAIINSDSFRLKQILLNFLSNAVKFTKSGFIKLSSELEESVIEMNNKKVKITVEDSGIGIQEEEKNNLFSHHQLIESYTSDEDLGSGLGLSISKQISEMMGWELTFSSIEGQGSKFSLCIPMTKDDKIVPPRFDMDSDSISQQTQQDYISFNYKTLSHLVSPRHIRLSSSLVLEKSMEKKIDPNMKCILVIDDNSIIVQSLSSLLKKCFKKNKVSNYEVIVGYDGADMIKEIVNDQIHGNRIVLTLLDENMEYIDGNEALQMIRKLESKNRIKKNFVCKVSAVREVNEEFSRLYDYYLNKPIKLEDLEQLFHIVNIF